jgi:predicted RNase H-like nuclease
MTVIAGIDGCRHGWVMLLGDPGRRRWQFLQLTTIAELLDLHPRPELVLIDIPIGLTHHGPRACDLAARALLRPHRHGSVFPAPIRPMLAAKTYPEACQIGLKHDGRKLSRQSWNILAKIREVDRMLCEYPHCIGWLREAHPEVSFTLANHGRPLPENKRTAAGQQQRCFLLKNRLGKRILELAQTTHIPGCQPDDLLDAAALFWSAARCLNGQAIILPDSPPKDAHGIPMEIVG